MTDHDSETFARFARRFAVIEVEVMDPPFLVARMATAPGSRRSLRPLASAVAIVAIVIAVAGLGPRLIGQMSAGPSASGSAVPSMGSEPPTGSARPTPAPSVAADAKVVCGRLDAVPCLAAIGLVRDLHPREVAAAWALVVDDVCPPPWVCDRLYPFDSVVVLVPPPGLLAAPSLYEVVGLGYQPERVEASWTGPLPAHIVALVHSLTPTGSPLLGFVALRTQEPQPSGTTRPCMTAYIEGTLVRVGQSGVALRAAATGPVVQVIWPNGYSARDEAGHLVVLDSSGSIVAQEGDRVSFGGGFTGQGTWYACSGPKILAP